MAGRAVKKTAKSATGSNKYDAWLNTVEYADKHTGHNEVMVERDDRWISTGVLTQDLALGGGFVEGRVTVLWGGEGEGKSTQLYMAIVTALDRGDVAIVYDHEGSFDVAYLKSIAALHAPNVDIDRALREKRLHMGPTFSGEETFRHMRKVLRKLPPPDQRDFRVFFALDSIAAVPSEADIEDEDADKMQRDKDGNLKKAKTAGMAGSARMYSIHWKKVKALLRDRGVSLVCTDQMRNKIGGYGNPEETSGGNSTKHNTDQRCRVKRKNPETWAAFGANKVTGLGTSGVFEESGAFGGNDQYSYHEATTVKNKVFSPFKTYNFRIWAKDRHALGRGVDPVADTMYYLLMTGQAERSGGFYKLNVEGQPDYQGVSVRWKDFKLMILAPKGKQVSSGVSLVSPSRKDDLRTICFKQIRDRSAFRLYAEQLKREASSDAFDVVEGKVVGIIQGHYRKSARNTIETVVGLQVLMPGDEVIHIGLPDLDEETASAWIEDSDLVVGQTVQVRVDVPYLLADMPALTPFDKVSQPTEQPAVKSKKSKKKAATKSTVKAAPAKAGKALAKASPAAEGSKKKRRPVKKIQR